MHFQTLYTILFRHLLLFIIHLTYDLNLLFNCLLRGFHTFELRIAECALLRQPPTPRLRRSREASGISWFSAFLFQTSPRQKYCLVELPLQKPSPNSGTNCAESVGTISSPYSARLSLCGGENWLDQKPTKNRKNLTDYTLIRSLDFFTLEV